MEEQDLLRLTFPCYVLSITWWNKSFCASYYQAIFWASHGRICPVDSHIIMLYIEHHLEEQDLLQLTLQVHNLRITWKNRTYFDSHYQAIYWTFHGGIWPVASHIISLYIEHLMDELDLFRLILQLYIYWASHGGRGPLSSHITALYIEHHMEEQEKFVSHNNRLYIELEMEEPDMLRFKLPRYIFSITWRNRTCCASI